MHPRPQAEGDPPFAAETIRQQWRGILAATEFKATKISSGNFWGVSLQKRWPAAPAAGSGGWGDRAPRSQQNMVGESLAVQGASTEGTGKDYSREMRRRRRYERRLR
jgi:hypothetical protein